MSAYIGNDLRIIKTEKALNYAITKLLKKNNFKKITVLDLCEEAQIGRATFYAHFNDKYSLLKMWLSTLETEELIKYIIYGQNEELLNTIINKNKLIIKNLIYEADNETINILSEYILSIFNLKSSLNLKMGDKAKSIVLSNFFTAGTIGYLLWQINNYFPPDITPINKYTLLIIEQFRKWDSEENDAP